MTLTYNCMLTGNYAKLNMPNEPLISEITKLIYINLWMILYVKLWVYYLLTDTLCYDWKFISVHWWPEN